jgi:hypothetical protein
MNQTVNGAIAAVRGNSLVPDLSGMVRFYDTPSGVRVDARIARLPVAFLGSLAIRASTRTPEGVS